MTTSGVTIWERSSMLKLHMCGGDMTSTRIEVGRELWPFNEERPPDFLLGKYKHRKSFGQASRYYQSLICFVKERNSLYLTDVTSYACRFLWCLSPDSWYQCSPDDILYKLVPTSDGSCSGFVESIVVLLTTNDDDLVKAALKLLRDLWSNTSPATHFDILASGLFALLPEYFYEEQLLDSQAPNNSDSSPDSTCEICEKRNISVESFHQTFVDYFLEPIEPFLEIIFTFRREFEYEKQVLIFSNLITKILESSPHMEQMTEYILSSSSFALAYTDSLAFFESHTVTVALLDHVLDDVCSWLEEYPTVQKRERQILAKLREEGLSDEIELFCILSGSLSGKIVLIT
ncbi:hypothetical protein BLNAU_10686 [Blattamonas nauphoetae]|uniref:Uncharacterized protein n=1 Tax=Blattamonas nauphoetae TaxID=2049346 RepID=A0ABQ9XSL7_9EUKA|nr:hypothetical protein BLNAU_10686 [Blattamonas nauphoetae]